MMKEGLARCLSGTERSDTAEAMTKGRLASERSALAEAPG